MPAPQRTPACSPRASFRPYRSMLPAAMKSLGLALLALLLCPSPGFPLLRRDTMTKATVIKDSISFGLVYSFRGSVHYHHGGKHGSMWTGMALEQELCI